jgi:hypothetical protein
MDVTRHFVKRNEQRFRKRQDRQTDQIRLVNQSQHNDASQEIQEAAKKKNKQTSVSIDVGVGI